MPDRYKNGTELLTSLKQSSSTDISDHIHEWRRRRRLVKVYILDQIWAEWFVKSLLPKITEDVAKASIVTEEQVIVQAQYLDLVYTQSGTLHEKILNLPKTTAPSRSHVADGMIGSVSIKSKKKSSKNSSPIITLLDSPTGDSSVEIPTNIHVVESSTPNQNPVVKGKGKRKINKTQKRNQIKLNLLMRNVNSLSLSHL